jgi:hypothetical protein
MNPVLVKDRRFRSEQTLEDDFLRPLDGSIAARLLFAVKEDLLSNIRQL